VSDHQWVLGAVSTTIDGPSDVISYFLPFACTKCGTTLRLKRPKSLVSFNLPFPEELRDNKINVDCDLTQVRQVMES
jgi:hypothetical protein